MDKKTLDHLVDIRNQIRICEHSIETITQLIEKGEYTSIDADYYTNCRAHISIQNSKLVENEIKSSLKRIKNYIQEAKKNYEKELNSKKKKIIMEIDLNKLRD